MTISEFKQKIAEGTEHKLYLKTRQYYIEELSGNSAFSRKLDALFDEAEKRKSSFYHKALEDAVVVYTSMEQRVEGMKVIELTRLDYMNDIELKEFIQKSGANLRTPVLDEESAKFSKFSDIFGINQKDLLICKVSGYSMIDADIHDGDTLMVNRKSEVKNGSIIVAGVEGNLFVKKYIVKDGKKWLYSENKNFEPFLIENENDVIIFGVVKHIIKTIE